MAVPEAGLERGEHGLVPQGDGWFVVNVADAQAQARAGGGAYCVFENPDGPRFADFGINVHVLGPGEPSSLYHREDAQEDFLVLTGECIALVEEREVPLRAGDFLHCPAGTDHTFVGAGSGPCAVLMVGARAAGSDRAVHYPVSALAARHGASAVRATDEPAEAYPEAGWERGVPCPPLSWPLPGS